MTNLRNGTLCVCLLLCAGIVVAPARAQEQKTDPPPADPAVALQAPSQPDPQQQVPQTPPQQTPPDTAAPQQQTPPQQTTPPQTTPPQTTPPQTTPAQTPETGVQPQRGRVPEPPPPPPKVPDVRRPGESGYFVGVLAWFPKQQPTFDRGHAATFTGNSLIQLQGTPKYAEGVEVGLAAGLHNSIRFSFFQARASGNTTVATDTVAWGQGYPAGTYVATNYDIRDFKLSYEYLTWPYPVGSRQFRLKTLWQVQYISAQTTFDAPKNYYDSNGNLIIDPNTGNPISLVGSGTRAIITPTLGLGAHYYQSRHLRFEANATGFVIPHHWTVWDVDGTINLRLIGHVELRLGAKAFHLKTSTQAEYFTHGTLASVFFGLRWYQLSE